MMSFRPAWQTAAMPARVRPGIICAALFLWYWAVWAQNIPAGYVATQEGDIIVIRPSAPVDPEVTIRIYRPFAANGDPTAIAHRWADSHPLAGVNAGSVSLQDSSPGPVVQGRYHIDGYLLHLEPAGGNSRKPT